MNSLQVFDYNGQLIQRRADGFVNLTQMCQANGKRLDNWLRLKSTQSYIATLSNSLTSEVVYSEEGVNGGTWGHPSVAINLARWLSDEFAVWCDAHIFNLMKTGQTSIGNPEPIRALPQRDTIDYVKAAAILPTLQVNGLLKQLLEDSLTDDLELMRNQKALASGHHAKRQFTIAKVRAKELGYSMERIGTGSQLGRFVAQQIKPAMVERVGKYLVNHYEVTPELDAAIHAYFR